MTDQEVVFIPAATPIRRFRDRSLAAVPTLSRAEGIVELEALLEAPCM